MLAGLPAAFVRPAREPPRTSHPSFEGEEPVDRVNPVGNERLTAAVGVLLLIPIIVELATIILGVHSFMSLHVFVGLTLIPAVLLKLGSTGWRFMRY
jgi:hypothetical protein